MKKSPKKTKNAENAFYQKKRLKRLVKLCSKQDIFNSNRTTMFTLSNHAHYDKADYRRTRRQRMTLTFYSLQEFCNMLSFVSIQSNTAVHIQLRRCGTVSQKKIPNIIDYNLKNYQIWTIFVRRHNRPRNNRSSSHLTQCVLVHYLGKMEHTK